ncbi:hypothetical protein [Comamonas sp. 4034]|uniref:hypothetical protein n=1 Tax=Comamonas sp. 4034 TaxID=3156455 RepID=UPI003D24FE77
MACDICGAIGTPLNDLLPSYQTAEIKALCPACEKEVNAKSMQLMTWAQRIRESLTKRFMQERKGMLFSKKPAPKEAP